MNDKSEYWDHIYNSDYSAYSAYNDYWDDDLWVDDEDSLAAQLWGNPDLFRQS